VTPRRLPAHLLIAALACVAALCVTLSAWAQNAPRMRASIQPTQAEVGETFIVQMTALAGQRDPPPSNPKVKLPAGVVLRAGPQIGPHVEASMPMGGQPTIRSGISVTWQLQAQRPGRFRIGPPSVEFRGKRYETNPVEIDIVPKGQKPQRGNNPFDPFNLLPQLPFPSMPGFDDDDWPFSPKEPPRDPSLSLPAAPAASVFLRSIVDKTRAVVGEQVTLSIYQYTRSGAPDAVDVHEATTSDFFQRSMLTPGTDPEPRSAQVGEHTWRVELLRRIALFPLKTGRLEIGPMRVSFAGFGLTRGRGTTAIRESNPLAVDVEEPPVNGRPVGYRGDVGNFSLGAQVEPRTAEAGGAVAVTVHLTGTGNLPQSLPVPARTGVEWLDPEAREKIEVRNDRIVGTRTFTYVVRLQQPGNIDLGEIVLPFFDPESKAYSSARTLLGSVKVRPGNAAPASSSSAERDPFESVATVRTSLGSVPARGIPWTDHRWFWILIAAGPLGVLLAGGLSTATRGVVSRLRTRQDSPTRLATLAIGRARKAAKAGNPAETAVDVERAVHGWIEGCTGLRSRGVLRSELAGRLRELDIDEETAERAATVLGECEAIRFDPETSRERLSSLTRTAEELGKKLGRARGTKGAK